MPDPAFLCVDSLFLFDDGSEVRVPGAIRLIGTYSNHIARLLVTSQSGEAASTILDMSRLTRQKLLASVFRMLSIWMKLPVLPGVLRLTGCNAEGAVLTDGVRSLLEYSVTSHAPGLTVTEEDDGKVYRFACGKFSHLLARGAESECVNATVAFLHALAGESAEPARVAEDEVTPEPSPSQVAGEEGDE